MIGEIDKRSNQLKKEREKVKAYTSKIKVSHSIRFKCALFTLFSYLVETTFKGISLFGDVVFT